MGGSVSERWMASASGSLQAQGEFNDRDQQASVEQLLNGRLSLQTGQEVGERTSNMDIQPYALEREEGSAVWFLGCLTRVKATGAQTGGAFGLIEQVFPPGFASPYHVHRREDETFYVLEGDMTFICDQKRWKVGPGAYLFLPRNIPHGFKLDEPAPARILILATPAGFEQFILEMSEPAKDLAHPPVGPPDMGKLLAVAAQYGIDILGPLPD